MIEIRNITAAITGTTLFKNFSLKIQPGENWVIQGANGSGKTLLLQLIAGAIPPLSGHIRHSFIEGKDWDALYQQRKEKIHFIPTHWMQTFLAGFNGLFYQQRYYNMDDTELPTVKDVFGEDIDKLKDLHLTGSFNIDHLLDMQLTRLSNGQLKKVVIVRQLVKNIPRVLILDYPFDGLDRESREELSAFIDEIVLKFGIQVILADHGPSLPKVINRRLTLRAFSIAKAEDVCAHDPPVPAAKIRDETAARSVEEPVVVDMQNLTVEYSGNKILSNVDWCIRRGERWALTGKNGSGKTTLFSLIYADHPMAYSQKVFLFGKRRGSGESIWDIKKRINYFGPEQIHFLNQKSILISGREYILKQHHQEPGRLAQLITYFQAENYIDLPVRHLSSGQLQIALLMNMFMDSRELLLLDEPFQFLDPWNHGRVTRYLDDYLSKNTTLVLITHDEKDVARWTQLRKQL